VDAGSGPAIPPPLELECLKALWNLGEGNVSQVRQELSGTRPLAYTTVMTVLDRLARKGVISRRKAGRAFLYAPQVSRETLRRVALRQLVDSFFDGSEEALNAWLGAGLPAPDGSKPREEPEAPLDTALL
jgi:predicted transcriptional regulator